MSDELEVRLKSIIEADEAASAKRIKGQIPGIEKTIKDTPIKVPVEMNQSSSAKNVRGQLKNLEAALKTTPIKIQLGVDIAASVRAIKSAIPTIQDAFKSSPIKIPFVTDTKSTKKAAEEAAKAAQEAVKKAGSSKGRAIVGDDDYQMRILKKRIEGLKYAESKAGLPSKLDWSGLSNAINVGDIKAARNEFRLLTLEFSNLNQMVRGGLDSQLKNLPVRIEKAVTAASDLAKKFASLKVQGGIIPDDALSRIEELKTKLTDFANTKPGSGQVEVHAYLEQFRELEGELISIGNLYKDTLGTLRTQKIEIGAERLKNDIDSLRSDFLKLREDYSKAFKDQYFLEKWKDGFNQINDSMRKMDVDVVRSKLRSLRKEIEAAGLNSKTIWGRLADNAKKFFNWFMIGGGVASAVRAVKELFTNVAELNKAFTDLKIVTNGTDAQTTALLNSYTKLAQRIGATTTEVAAAASDWLRQGRSVEETATLIENSMMLSKIGSISSADATTYLTSAMKGYNIEASKAVNIVDKLTTVDLISATSAAGLASGLSEVANNANLAGVSIDKLLGYLASIGEVTQDNLSEVGHSLSTMFSRMGNIKLSRLEDYQNGGESLNNVETVLNTLGIRLRDSNSEFRNFGDVLDEVASKWKTYTSVEQRALATAFASKNNMEDFFVLMENYGRATEYATKAAQANGTAMQKMAAYTNSLEAKQKRLAATAEGLSSALINSELISFTYDSTTGILGFLTSIIEKLGSLPAVASAAAAALSFKNVGWPKMSGYRVSLPIFK